MTRLFQVALHWASVSVPGPLDRIKTVPPYFTKNRLFHYIMIRLSYNRCKGQIFRAVGSGTVHLVKEGRQEGRKKQLLQNSSAMAEGGR